MSNSARQRGFDKKITRFDSQKSGGGIVKFTENFSERRVKTWTSKDRDVKLNKQGPRVGRPAPPYLGVPTVNVEMAVSQANKRAIKSAAEHLPRAATAAKRVRALHIKIRDLSETISDSAIGASEVRFDLRIIVLVLRAFTSPVVLKIQDTDVNMLARHVNLLLAHIGVTSVTTLRDATRLVQETLLSPRTLEDLVRAAGPLAVPIGKMKASSGASLAHIFKKKYEPPVIHHIPLANILPAQRSWDMKNHGPEDMDTSDLPEGRRGRAIGPLVVVNAPSPIDILGAGKVKVPKEPPAAKGPDIADACAKLDGIQSGSSARGGEIVGSPRVRSAGHQLTEDELLVRAKAVTRMSLAEHDADGMGLGTIAREVVVPVAWLPPFSVDPPNMVDLTEAVSYTAAAARTFMDKSDIARAAREALDRMMADHRSTSYSDASRAGKPISLPGITLKRAAVPASDAKQAKVFEKKPKPLPAPPQATASGSPKAAAVTQAPGKKDAPKEEPRPCFDFRNGKCNRKNCKFLHEATAKKEERAQQDPPDQKLDRAEGDKPKQDQCDPVIKQLKADLALKTLKMEDATLLEVERMERIKLQWIVAAPPIVETLALSDNTPLHGTYDVMASPFCGVASIDMALTGKVDLKHYLSRTVGMTDYDAVRKLGTREGLVAHAASRGVNLCVWSTPRVTGTTDVIADDFAIQRVTIQRDVLGRDALINFCASPAFKWVHLEYTAGCAGATGHFKLFVWPHAHDDQLGLPSIDRCVQKRRWGFKKATYIKTGPVALNVSDADRRNVVSKRDGLQYQESVREIHERKVLRFSIGKHSLDLWSYAPKRYHVLEKACVAALSEAEGLAATGRDPQLCLAGLNSVRELNSFASGTEGLVVNSARFIRKLTADYVQGDVIPTDASKLVTPYVSGEESIIKNPDVVIANQLRGAGNLGTQYNHVQKSRWEIKPRHAAAPMPPVPPPKDIYATADAIVFETDQGIIGAGMCPKTTGESILAAAMTRGMCKDPDEVDPNKVDEAVDKVQPFMDKLVDHTPLDVIDRTGLTGVFEEDNKIIYARQYKSKFSQEKIAATIADYEDYLAGRMSLRRRKKYKRHGCFVKKESNIKWVWVKGGPRGKRKVKMRPRMIMTMSPLMTMECVQFTSVIHAFNLGPIRKFQVKGLSGSELSRKITEMCQRRHTVTDVSAFESSLTERIRAVESRLIVRLLHRAGLDKTAERYVWHTAGQRRLTTNYGHLMFGTRCSGDFWTSLGNGVTNLALLVVSAVDAGADLDKLIGLLEGDDGLVKEGSMDAQLLKDLGFDFSSELTGSQPGDVDFLRSRWIGEDRLLDVGRSLGVVWVKGASHLKRSKRLWLLRAAGQSLHHLSPGHPILCNLVNRIGRATRGISPFKNWERFIDTWKQESVQTSNYPRDVKCKDYLMRHLAEGAMGFPPISYASQYHIMDQLDDDSTNTVYISSCLNSYDDVAQRVAAHNGLACRSTDTFYDSVEGAGIRAKYRLDWARPTT